MSTVARANPKWLWWIVFAIYSFFCVLSFLQYAVALSPWAIPRSVLLLVPIGLFGFVRQVPLLRREVWAGLFLLGCAWSVYGLVAMFVPVLAPDAPTLELSPVVLPMLVAWVLMWTLPVLYALWAYAFRSPHLWQREPVLMA